MHPPTRALRPTLWPPVAAAPLLLLLLIPSAGHAATASQRIVAMATAANLDPSASWHGRSVRRVVRSAAPAARRTRATAFFDLRPGAGYATARGSAAVRMLQRRLRKLGYSPGPVDGRYGPRTRDAVGWFQLKHGLRVDGVAGAATQRRLQARVSGGPVAGTGRRSKPSAAERFTPAATTHAPARPVRTTHAATPSAPWALAGFGVLGVLGVLAAAGVGTRLRRRRGRGAPEGTAILLAQPLHVEGHSSDPAIGDFAGTAAALHVSPPTAGTEASPAIRYCVIDDDTRTSVWVAADAIRESRPVTTPGPRTTVHGAARQPARSLVRPTGRFARGRVTSRR